ncbi:MAG TPA: A/G-specific adenine glycosylase [Acidobacteriota bacterium]|nr:A/G-specific adenine glycosylase [Acidobacteriota bacterium]
MAERVYRVWTGNRAHEFQRLLLAWYEDHKRGLPWRSNPTPYRVWVSEIMLQQTQVRTVMPYYERFLERFPDVRSLAEATEEEVLTLWAGLGYYSRARNLHRAARELLRANRGRIPRRMEEVMRLPGIGRYTAGAICSIAFNQPQPIVDGNVRRVMTRLHGIETNPLETFFWKQASAWVHPTRPSDFNQAIMELGALVCQPSLPFCGACPVQSLCVARRKGIQNQIPVSHRGRAVEEVEMVALVITLRGRILVTSERSVTYIPGGWSLPYKEIKESESPREAARALARKLCGRTCRFRELGLVRHGITHRRLLVQAFYAELDSTPQRDPGDSRDRWIGIRNLDDFVISSLFKKIIGLALPRKSNK